MMIITISPLLYSCSDDKPGGWFVDERTVLTIDNYNVSYDEFRYFYLNYKRDYDLGDESFWQKNPASAADLKADVVDRLRENSALRRMAYEFDIELSKEEMTAIDEQIKASIDTYGGEDGYRAALSEYFMTGDVFRMTLELRQLEIRLREYLMDEFTGNILSDDRTVDEDIHNNFIHVRHILIRNEDGDNIEANLELARELRKRAVSGEDFDMLIKNYSEDPGYDFRHGYYFTYGEFLEQFEDAAYKLDIGEISEVVETVNGFHIIQRLELDEDYIDTYFEELREVYKNRCFNDQQDELAEKLEIEYTDLFDMISIETMK